MFEQDSHGSGPCVDTEPISWQGPQTKAPYQGNQQPRGAGQSQAELSQNAAQTGAGEELGYGFGHISERVLLLWGHRGALGAQLRAGEAAAPLAEPTETPKTWAQTERRWRNILAGARAVNGIPLTLISLEFELDSVSCPKMGSTIPG